jgi:hypothetical protein
MFWGGGHRSPPQNGFLAGFGSTACGISRPRCPLPGTSSLAHLRENIAAADLLRPADALAELDTIGRQPPQSLGESSGS